MAMLPRPQAQTAAAIYRALALAFSMIERGFPAPTYTTATKPAATSVGPGTIIFVSDGGAGANFQGSDGTNWKNLG